MGAGEFGAATEHDRVLTVLVAGDGSSKGWIVIAVGLGLCVSGDGQCSMVHLLSYSQRAVAASACTGENPLPKVFYPSTLSGNRGYHRSSSRCGRRKSYRPGSKSQSWWADLSERKCLPSARERCCRSPRE